MKTVAVKRIIGPTVLSLLLLILVASAESVGRRDHHQWIVVVALPTIDALQETDTDNIAICAARLPPAGRFHAEPGTLLPRGVVNVSDIAVS